MFSSGNGIPEKYAPVKCVLQRHNMMSSEIVDFDFSDESFRKLFNGNAVALSVAKNNNLIAIIERPVGVGPDINFFVDDNIGVIKGNILFTRSENQQPVDLDADTIQRLRAALLRLKCGLTYKIEY